MNKYKVKVRVEQFTTIEVEAEDEASAITKAVERAGWGYHSFSSGRPIDGKVIDSGPVGEPLVRCPTEWEVYSSMAGSKRVNSAITTAAKKCAAEMLAASKKGQDVGPKFVLRLAEKHVAPVFKRYSKYGTGDTEPRANMANYLAKYAKALGAADGDAIYEEVRWSL